MRKRQRIIFFVLIIQVISLQTQTQNELGMPFIRNFKADEYDASAQNWAVLQDKRGVMYFGNNSCILEFDGKYWRAIPLPNYSLVRSLAMDENGTIYVGAVEEFGYLASDRTGELRYVSLKDKIKEEDRFFKDVWSCCATTHGIYFITGNKIFRWHNNTISIIPASIMLFGFSVYDKVFAVQRDEGICFIDKGQLWLLPHTDDFVREPTGRRFILPYTENKILIATENKGFFVYNFGILFEKGKIFKGLSEKNIPSDIVKKIPTEIDEYVHHNYIYSCVKINDDRYAFATLNGGVVIIDRKGKLVQLINKNRGLYKNMVNSIHVDNNQNLWAALNNGISYIEISSPITQFSGLQGLDEMVLSIFRLQGRLYVGSYDGIFYLPEYKMSLVDDKYHFRRLSKNWDCWDLISIKNTLFASCSPGVVQIRDTLVEEHDLEGKYVYCFGRSKKFPDHIFLGLRHGFTALKVESQDFERRRNQTFYSGAKNTVKIKLIKGGSFENIQEEFRRIVSDNNGDLWITTYINGIIFIKFTGSDVSDFQIYRYNKSHGLPRDDWNVVYFIDSRLIVATQSGIYEGILPKDFQTNPTGVKFVPEETFGKIFLKDSISVSQIGVDEKQNMLLRSGMGLGRLIKNQDGTYTWDGVPFNKIRGSSENFLIESDGIVWHPTENAFYRIDLTKQKDYKNNYNTLIRKVIVHGHRAIFNGTYYDPIKKSSEYYTTSSLDQPDQLIKTLDHKNNSVTFEYSATFYEHGEANRFKYMLDGFDKDWSDWIAETHKEYTNLPEGNYCFKVKAKNIFEHESTEALFNFSISPPWHRTIFAYISFVLIFLLIIYGAVMFNSRRLIAAKHKLEKIVKERTIELEESNYKLEEAFGQLADANKKLEKLATTDGLTGIANYRYFEEFYDNEWRRCIRSGKPISVIMIDVDFFKLYNDTYGHQMGDLCLKEVAKVLNGTVNRAGDIVARYGGEEFVIVLSETDSKGANIIAEKIRIGVESLEMVHEESDISEYVTISAGCATTIPKKDMDSSLLIKAADNTLYQSKKNGRNRITVVQDM